MVSTDWDRVAVEEESRIAAEDARLAEQSNSALGLNRDAPSGVAEHEEIRKRIALKEAKDVWRRREDAAVAQKYFISGESGVTRVITSDEVTGGALESTSGESLDGPSSSNDLNSQKPTKAVHVKNCKDCTFTLHKDLRLAKIFVEDCTNVQIDVQCLVITQHLEVWGCQSTTIKLTAPVLTVQADSCCDCEINLNKKSDLGAVVHATCSGFLTLKWDGEESGEESNKYCIDLVRNEKSLEPSTGPIKLSKSGVHETPQFITRLINHTPTTERVVRDKDEYPTTAREMLLDRAEQAAAGDKSAIDAIKNNAPIDLDTTKDRAEKRKEHGNDAFKQGNYPQAIVHYTSALELNPGHHVALSNRSACFLKLGEHEKALSDAKACVAIGPKFTKGLFRFGLALHALGRFVEAAETLAKAEQLDPNNTQIKDALRMASFKARQVGERG